MKWMILKKVGIKLGLYNIKPYICIDIINNLKTRNDMTKPELENKVKEQASELIAANAKIEELEAKDVIAETEDELWVFLQIEVASDNSVILETRAMEIPNVGVIVKTKSDISETSVLVPLSKIVEKKNDKGEIISRKLISSKHRA
jgi:hypothetical protein